MKKTLIALWAAMLVTASITTATPASAAACNDDGPCSLVLRVLCQKAEICLR